MANVAQVGFLSTAARCCGIRPAVCCEWVARGLGRDPDRPPTRLFAEFADAVERARGEFELARLQTINEAAGKPAHWRAAAWQLERFAPERYGRRRFVDVSGMVPLVEVRALLVAVVSLVDRYVPEERRESELDNLIAAAEQIAGGALGGR